MKRILLLFVTILLTPQMIPAQNKADLISKDEKKEVITSISELLVKNYIFPDVAEKLKDYLSDNLRNGNYDQIKDPEQFATILTQDLQEISSDKHLRVFFDPEEISERKKTVSIKDSLAFVMSNAESMSRRNYGFKEIRILQGNIGYLDLRMFYDPHFAGETAIAAMQFLSSTDAIIIDLRNNGGGEPSMIQLISSYFFNNNPIHLNNFYWRPIDQLQQTWTLPYVPGNKLSDTDLYLLIGPGTFSAAEEFAYNMQNLKRAILIGDATGGAAHAGDIEIATDRYMIWVPSGRAISPITGTNWEGVGVSPSIHAPQQEALVTARILALEKLLEKSSLAIDKKLYSWHLLDAKIELNPISVEEKILKSFAGKYGPRTITFKNGQLYYKRSGPEFELTPLKENLFMIKEVEGFRLKFVRDGTNVTALQGVYISGESDLFNKTE